MKTSSTNRNPATSQFDPSHSARRIAIACAMLGAVLFAQGASACPPGYRQKGPACVPGPAQPQSHYMKTIVPHPGGIVPITKSKPHPIQGKILDPHKVPPQIGPGPIEHHTDASSTHGIIFVGGHAKPQYVKQALNPQPIPPGHVSTVQSRLATPTRDVQPLKSVTKPKQMQSRAPISQSAQHMTRINTGAIPNMNVPCTPGMEGCNPTNSPPPPPGSLMCAGADHWDLPCRCGPTPGTQPDGCTKY